MFHCAKMVRGKGRKSSGSLREVYLSLFVGLPTEVTLCPSRTWVRQVVKDPPTGKGRLMGSYTDEEDPRKDEGTRRQKPDVTNQYISLVITPTGFGPMSNSSIGVSGVSSCPGRPLRLQTLIPTVLHYLRVRD